MVEPKGGKYGFRYVTDLLKYELLSKDGVLPLPVVRLSHLDAIQVDVTVGVGEILHWQLVGLLHIQHQAAHLRGKKKKEFRKTLRDAGMGEHKCSAFKTML